MEHVHGIGLDAKAGGQFVGEPLHRIDLPNDHLRARRDQGDDRRFVAMIALASTPKV